ncbi:MAG: ABC transporter ATP-binding protein [Acidimicrobiales bacterium]
MGEVAPELLRVERLCKSFSGVQAAHDVSFTVPPGEIIGLIGPNGAGKSTVVGLVGGSLRPDSGDVLFRGASVNGVPTYRRARHGLVRTYQLSSEFQRLTVLENMLAGAQRQHGERFRVLLQGKRAWRQQERQLVASGRALLDRFGLRVKEDEYAGNLSGGERRLLELARALMASPELLLLDEPMAGVNPSFMRTVERHLLEVNSEGIGMLIVEHDLDVLERLCDSVVVMARGAVIARGNMADHRADPEVRKAYLIG